MITSLIHKTYAEILFISELLDVSGDAECIIELRCGCGRDAIEGLETCRGDGAVA